MTDSLNEAVCRSAIIEVTAGLFESMLGYHVLPLETAPDLRAEATAFINMSGAWNGTLTLECTWKQAAEFAGRILGASPEDLQRPLVADGLGEVANILAGNLKAALWPGVYLGQPSIVQGGDYWIALPGAHPVARVCFEAGCGLFGVELREKAVRPAL